MRFSPKVHKFSCSSLMIVAEIAHPMISLEALQHPSLTLPLSVSVYCILIVRGHYSLIYLFLYTLVISLLVYLLIQSEFNLVCFIASFCSLIVTKFRHSANKTRIDHTLLVVYCITINTVESLLITHSKIKFHKPDTVIS